MYRERERKSEKVYQKTQYNRAKKNTFFSLSVLAFSIAPLEGRQNRHHIIKFTVKTRLLELYFHKKNALWQTAINGMVTIVVLFWIILLISFYTIIESLFGCFDDCNTCVYGTCCTSCLFGRNAEKIDESNCCAACCAYLCLSNCFLCWLPHYFKRRALREKYGLEEDPKCSDLPATICCSPCAICQETRFLKHNGVMEPRTEISNFVFSYL